MPKFKKIEIKKDDRAQKVRVCNMKNFQDILLCAAAKAGKNIIARNPGLFEAIESAKTEEDFEKISDGILI